jgi:hypothetical protein
MKQPVFRPWFLDLQLSVVFTALAGLAACLLSGDLALRWHGYLLSFTLVFGAGALIFGKRFFIRFNGQVVEVRALNDLAKRHGSSWALTRNVPLPAGGDLDGLLRGPDGQSFALEIKSKVSVKIVRGVFGIQDMLVDHDGVAQKSMLQQAKRNAYQVGAVPVLWFPNGRDQSYSKNVQGVVVVCGPGSFLVRSLGLRGRAWW